ncbi:MAG TPA: Zn-dependent hydrolase [Ktedonobacteraceae bacterium]
MVENKNRGTVRIDPSTIEQYVETLGTIGQQAGGGIIRPVYSSAWQEARAQLAEWMLEAGLEVYGDAVGNLFGRLRGTVDDAHTILTGSHFDTVPFGGKFDGALGILAGLAALQALLEQKGRPRRSLEVVALCEEEGSRFPARYWGSRGILGLIQAEELDTLRDNDGVTIADAMRMAGFPPERYREAIRHDLSAFLELHIEQGRILFDEKIDVGIVEAIAGILHQKITVEGRADHAGTTPMDLRRDALQGAALMALEITRMVEREGRPAVVTMGKWDVSPGAVNIVPGQVHFSVDLRHPMESTKQRLREAIRLLCETIAQERGLLVTIETENDGLPVEMNSRLQEVLINAAEACGAAWKRLPSGAGHDSQVMAQHTPTAMLFVPSIEGRSHSPAEFTTFEDAARGASVLATTLYHLAYEQSEENPDF